MASVLYPEESLVKGTLKNKLVSNNGKYELILQDDGNLILHQTSDKKVIFASNTAGNYKIDVAKFQSDGNFVLYEKGGKIAAWSSKTEDMGIKFLQLGNTGAIALYNEDNKIVNVVNRNRWMSVIDDNVQLNQVCMPGSHDAGMYWTSLIVGTGFILTQNDNLYEQLNYGVRYFDLRVKFTDPTFIVYHPSDSDIIKDGNGKDLYILLEDVRKFIEENPTETIILNFSHWGNFTSEGGRTDNWFINLLIQIFPLNLLLDVNYDTDIKKMSLSNLRGKVIIRIENDTMYKNSVKDRKIKGIFGTEKEIGIFDKYSDQREYDLMLKDQMSKYGNYTGDNLFLLNWTLTPNSPFSSSVLTYAKNINPKITDYNQARDFLFFPNQFEKIVNIINGDYWDLCPQKVMKACFEVMNNRNVKRYTEEKTVKNFGSTSDERLTMDAFSKENELTQVFGEPFQNYVNYFWRIEEVRNEPDKNRKLCRLQDIRTGLYMGYKSDDYIYGDIENVSNEELLWWLESLGDNKYNIVSYKRKESKKKKDRLDLSNGKAYLNEPNDGLFQKWEII